MAKKGSRKNIGSDFFEQVYSVTRCIPHGRVTSYGAIARFIGAPGAARMVGWALNKSGGREPFIPAHRVVNRNGLLSGKSHFPGSDTMQEMLECEGVKVDDNCVENFEALFWDPSKELKPFS
ncbi:MGMT family protein [Geofilum sp. OHC36d9]|uniref:MGMT family protein n=1 Tax=Geofilum sp. OHC36d9 TaxID=3458413 RepID=UPI0040346FB1